MRNRPLRVSDVHAYGLETSTALSDYSVPNYIKPLDLVSVLAKKGVRSVLVGSHGMGGWTQEPRAARDIVLLVAVTNHKKATQTLRLAFPHLTVEYRESVTTLCDPDPTGVVIDLLRPVLPVQQKVLVKTHTLQLDGQRCFIPSLESALALVFDAMTRLPWSSAEKYFNAGDFIRMAQANPDVNFKELAALGEWIYKGAGEALVKKVKRVQAGEILNL